VTKDAGYCTRLSDPDFEISGLPGSNNTMTRCEANIDFYSMQYSLLINVAVVGAGAMFFFLTSIWIVKDKLNAENPDRELVDKNANVGETKEMLGIMERGGLEESIDDDDVPPTMIISKSEVHNPLSHPTYDQRFTSQCLNQAMEEYSPTGRRTKPNSTLAFEEESASANNGGYHPLNTVLAMSKFQRLLDSPDTSSERLDGGNISTSSSSSPSPATPKSLKA